MADRTNRYDEALLYIQKAMEKTPDDPAVIDSMGWVQFKLGNLDKAREYLQRAWDMTGDPEIAAHLGEVLWTQGYHQQARKLWDEARKKKPGNKILEDTVRRLVR
ncbi:MAG TPA: tetratricopeptide repeat protein [Gammaproteobacteria bacterium]|nr:tetratricopeptide repeat protein [Gammaproteobacteria bacterium]